MRGAARDGAIHRGEGTQLTRESRQYSRADNSWGGELSCIILCSWSPKNCCKINTSTAAPDPENRLLCIKSRQKSFSFIDFASLPMMHLPQIITSMAAPDPEQLLLFASTRLPQRPGSPRRLKLVIRKLDIPDFAGPGKSAET